MIGNPLKIFNTLAPDTDENIINIVKITKSATITNSKMKEYEKNIKLELSFVRGSIGGGVGIAP